MSRRVIIDCDPGIDDAVALCLALFDPRLDVVAVTATAGNVDGHQASRNVQAIIERLDPPRWPRIGTARPRTGQPVDGRMIHGPDGLGNAAGVTSELHHQHPSDKVIGDAIRNFPHSVTVISLGPLTNIAAALSRDPDLAGMIDQIIMMGGAVGGVGNVTPAAEFNIYSDPAAARLVFGSPITKTLVPLDATSKIVFPFDFVNELPDPSTRAGAFLHDTVSYLFRSYRQEVGLEGILLHDPIALMATVHPELFTTVEMAGDVETVGELTLGATVFDRRHRRQWRNNMAVVTELDVEAVTQCIARGLRFAGQESR